MSGKKSKLLALASLAISASLCLASCTGSAGGGRIEDTRDITEEQYTTYSLSGTDALGRTVSPIDGEKEGKYVGMFYFLWCGAHSLNKYDINYLLENDPDALWASTDPDSLQGTYHYWGEPLYGYYHQLDPWVVSRHVEMFVNSGIDFLGLDVTNAVTYDAQVQVLLDTLLKYYEQGFDVPQVMFLTRSSDIATAVKLYEKWYANEETDENGVKICDKYAPLWFAPNGKPMISCSVYGWESDDLTDEENAYRNTVKQYFDIKYNQWPDEAYNPNGFAWMEFTCPQPVHENSRMISVSVAQHTSSKMSNQSVGNRGRSYNYSTVTNEDDRVNEGLNYQAQWNTALEAADETDIVFVTGWNEWQAIKFNDSQGNVYFVDTFNTNYSRDIEPMKDGYGDNYYMQTVQNVREYKSTGSSSYVVESKTIDIDGSLSQWDDVRYTYRDFEGDTMDRDFQGSIAGYHYTDTSGRNDIVTTKVVTDGEYAYFYVQTAENIEEYTSGTNWMNILISVDGEGFAGYDYLINARPNGNTTTVSRFTGSGFEYTNTASADLRVNGNVMLVRVSLSDIGLSGNNVQFSFKVCDNVTSQGDIMDYYVSGDCAPLGRLNYTYGY